MTIRGGHKGIIPGYYAHRGVHYDIFKPIFFKTDVKVFSKDDFQKFLRNLVPFCKEFMALSDIFGFSDRNFTILFG